MAEENVEDGLNTVPVLRQHLHDIKRTLTFVEGLLAARDLQAGYVKMAALNYPSKLTTAVQGLLWRVDGYLAEEEPKTESEDSE